MKKQMKRLTAFLLTILMLSTNLLTAFAADESDIAEQHVLTVEVSGNGDVMLEGAEISKTDGNTYLVAAGCEVTVFTVPSEGSESGGMDLNETPITEDVFLMPAEDSVLSVVFTEIQQKLGQEETEITEPQESEQEETEITEPQELEQEETEITEQQESEQEKTEITDPQNEEQEIEKSEENTVNIPGVPKLYTERYLKDLQLTGGYTIPMVSFYSARANGNLTTGRPVYYDGYSTNEFYVDGNFAYCAEPSKSTPASGSYTKVYDFKGYLPTGSAEQAEFVRRVLYYSYGSPGFDAGMFPSTWFDGSPMNNDRYIALSHIMVSDVYAFDAASSMAGCSRAFMKWVAYNVTGYDITTGAEINPNSTRHQALAKGAPDTFTAFILDTGSGQNILGFEYNPTGDLELQKASAIPEITNGNSCYSLEGAVYGLYKNGNEITRLTTDANGYAKVTGINADSYLLKELTAPKGFALDRTEYQVVINSGQLTRIGVKDYPQSDPVSILLGKVDAETTQNMPQGSASLGNAEFTIKYYDVQSNTDPAEMGKAPVRTWVMKTDERGFTRLGEKYKVSGDGFYFNTIGDVTLPLGTITIQETKAPKGYLLNNEIFVRQITSQGAAEQVETYNMPTIPETPQKGIIRLEKKSSEADYGTATLKGAEYGIYKDAGCTDKVDTLTTDNAGKAQSKELPWGTYYVKETKNPVGFMIDPNVYTVDLTTDNKTDRVFYKTVTSTEIPQKGIIKLQKLDSETDKNDPQGAASLKDAKYDIFLKSAYQAGDSTEAKSYKGTLITDENGKAKSGELPLETYYVIEREASEGYLVDPTIHEVTLSSDNRTDRVFTKKVTSEEDIIRGNVEIIKLKEIEDEDVDTFEGLEGVEFTFTSDTTGKVVKKIVTDKYGFATTVDKNNPRGGLLFDTYTVTETKWPEGLKPIEPFKVTIKEEGVTLKGIYKEDKLIVSPVSVVKIDESTGKVIPVADTEFRLLDENKKPIIMTTYYPNKVEHETFKTDENGQFTFPDKLKYGTYYLEEINAPEGYLKGELLEFRVTEGATWEKPLIVKYADENAMGQIAITKTSLDKNEKLAGAVFEIRAAEDIVTPDGTVRMKKGDLAESVTTGKNGTATSQKLFLGKYDVKETQQPQGFILNEKNYSVELKYKDQVTEIVTEEISVTNKPTEIEILKVDKDTEKPLEGVTFKIWNKAMLPENETDQDAGDNLQDNMGVFTEEDKVDPDAAVISEYKTDADGKINLQYLTPGTYCIQEKETIDGYVLNDEIYEIVISIDGRVDGEEVGKITVKNEITKIDLSKHDLSSGKEIEGGKYQVLDKKGEVIDEWKGTKEPHRIQGLTVGETYIFKEVLAPEGYLLAQDVEFTIESTGEVQTVKMYDELAMGSITIRKTDSETGDKVSGTFFKVTAAEDIVTPDGTVRMKKGDIADYIRTENGVAKTQPLFLGKYDVKESRVAPGYILNEKIYHAELKYKDQTTAIVTTTVDIENVPNKVVIEKTKAGTNDRLEGVTFKVWNKAMLPEDETDQVDPDAAVVSEYKTDADGKIELQYLAPGTYCIQEKETIDGYVLDNTIYEFTIDKNGMFRTDGEPQAIGAVKIENDYTKVEISKQDATTGQELPGAKLELIYKETDEVIDRWTSGKKPHYFECLKTGEYILREISAPRGYKVAEDITFTVQETGEIQKVVMKDEYSVGGLKPHLPGNRGNGLLTALRTGDYIEVVPWILLSLFAIGMIITIVGIRHQKKQESEDKNKE